VSTEGVTGVDAVVTIDARLDYIRNQRTTAKADMMSQVDAELLRYDIAIQELTAIRAQLVGESYDAPIDYGTHKVTPRLLQTQQRMSSSPRRSREEVISPKTGTPVPTSVQSLRDKMSGG